MKEIVAGFRDGDVTKSGAITLYSGGMPAPSVTDSPPGPDRWHLPDSELAEVIWQPGPGPGDGALALRFSAAALSRPAADGRDRPGYLGPVYLRLTGVAPAPERGDQLWMGRVGTAELQAAGQRVGPLPLPFPGAPDAGQVGEVGPGAPPAPGPWRLSLARAHGGQWVAEGQGLQAWADPAARFHESLAC